MSKSKRRFDNREQILEEIEKYKATVIRCVGEAEEYERQAKHLFTIAEYSEEAKYRMLRAKRLRRRAFLIEDNKLPSLIQLLSVMDTPMLPCCQGEDTSIPVAA